MAAIDAAISSFIKCLDAVPDCQASPETPAETPPGAALAVPESATAILNFQNRCLACKSCLPINSRNRCRIGGDGKAERGGKRGRKQNCKDDILHDFPFNISLGVIIFKLQ